MEDTQPTATPDEPFVPVVAKKSPHEELKVDACKFVAHWVWFVGMPTTKGDIRRMLRRSVTYNIKKDMGLVEVGVVLSEARKWLIRICNEKPNEVPASKGAMYPHIVQQIEKEIYNGYRLE